MRKSIVGIMVVLLAVIMIFTGCDKNDKDNNKDTDNQENASNDIKNNDIKNNNDKNNDVKKYPANSLQSEKLIDTESDNYVVMIGNSLLQKGDVAKRFENIVNAMGNSVTTEGEYFMGKSLAEIADYITETDGLEYVGEELAEADVVIFQEYGGYYDTTLEDMKKYIDTYCSDDVVAYYYSTEFDSDYSQLNEDYIAKYEDAGINVLLTCDMLSRLNEEFGYEYFHLEDYHPNELSGYFSALFLYSKLYKVSATEVPINIMDETAYELMPGNSDEEKANNYDIITNIIDEIGR